LDPLSALIFVAILLLSALFSGTETAITAVSEVSLKREAETSRRAALIQSMLKDRGRVIAALLVGNNIVNVALAVFATVVFDGMLRDGGTLPDWAAPVLASVLSVSVLLVFGEVLPKTLAVTFRVRWAMTAAYPIVALTVVLKPITWLLTKFSNVCMRLLGRQPGEDDIFDVHEIHAMASMSEQAGVIDPLERQLIHTASQLNDTRVREIMVPRTDMQALSVSATRDQVRALFKKTPFTRIPIYKGDLDDIVGILNFKEFMRHDPGSNSKFDMQAFLHKPLFVSSAMFIGDLLNEMRAQRVHIAIALDEYGGTSGLITLEDVVEMLVGRIDDEYDVVTTPIEQIDATTWEVDGRVTDEMLVEATGIELPPEVVAGFDTAAGLALKAFGNIPSEGDAITYHGIEIRASRVRGQRVRRVIVRVLSPEEQESVPDESAARSTRRKSVRHTATIAPPADSAKADGTTDDITDDSQTQSSTTPEGAAAPNPGAGEQGGKQEQQS
jgi:putative hemolysin